MERTFDKLWDGSAKTCLETLVRCAAAPVREPNLLVVRANLGAVLVAFQVFRLGHRVSTRGFDDVNDLLGLGLVGSAEVRAEQPVVQEV
jgi:hypothetical protein